MTLLEPLGAQRPAARAGCVRLRGGRARRKPTGISRDAEPREDFHLLPGEARARSCRARKQIIAQHRAAGLPPSGDG